MGLRRKEGRGREEGEEEEGVGGEDDGKKVQDQTG